MDYMYGKEIIQKVLVYVYVILQQLKNNTDGLEINVSTVINYVIIAMLHMNKVNLVIHVMQDKL